MVACSKHCHWEFEAVVGLNAYPKAIFGKSVGVRFLPYHIIDLIIISAPEMPIAVI